MINTNISSAPTQSSGSTTATTPLEFTGRLPEVDDVVAPPRQMQAAPVANVYAQPTNDSSKVLTDAKMQEFLKGDTDVGSIALSSEYKSNRIEQLKAELTELEAAPAEITALVTKMGKQAQSASKVIGTAESAQQRTQALRITAERILKNKDVILAANQRDVEAARVKYPDPRPGQLHPMVDRLQLNDARIKDMVEGLQKIADMKDPIGEVIATLDPKNPDLAIDRVRKPLGVIGVIYESRPNVTIDAGALCLKSGNAVILRGGSESNESSKALHACFEEGLEAAGLPKAAVQLIPTKDRAAVGEMLKLNESIDVIVPRGGKSLVARVQDQAKVPVFAHLDGVNHQYLDKDADPQKALDVILDSKMRRTGVCGATECLLVHKDTLETILPAIITALKQKGCEIRGDERIQMLDSDVKPAVESDYGQEFLAPVLAIKVVENAGEAMEHISTYGSGHTEGIICENTDTCDEFSSKVDSAIVTTNASTQFADGGEFGMGAEIGIATGKMHARGPIGVEQLTTMQYVVKGDGTIRG